MKARCVRKDVNRLLKGLLYLGPSTIPYSNEWRSFMKKGKIIIAVIASVVSIAALTTAALIICRKLFEKNYFTVTE